MKNTVFFAITMLCSSLFAAAEDAKAVPLQNDSLEVSNILLAVADQVDLIPGIKNFTIDKIDKGFAKDIFVYLLTGLEITDGEAQEVTLRVIKTIMYQWGKSYPVYEVDYLSSQELMAQNFLQWQSLCNESAEVANLMLDATHQITLLPNFRDLQITRGEKSYGPDREIYNFAGMEFVGHSVIDGFSLVITKVTKEGPLGISHDYEIDYDGVRHENLPLRPPALVRS